MKKILFFLIIAVFVINIFDIRNDHDWGDDFSGYINQAEAIVSHDIAHLKDISNKRVQMSEFQVGPSLYPWGYPVILALAILFFGTNLVALKFFTYIFFIGSAIVFYCLIRDKLPKNLALLLVLVFSSSPFFFSFKQAVLSDVPSMFFLLLSLYFVEVVYFQKKEIKKNRIFFVILGVAMFLSCFVRANSFIILPTLFLIQLINWKKCFRSWRNAIDNIIPYFVFLALYFLSSIILPNSSYAETHTLFPADILNGIMSNAEYYSVLLFEFFGRPESILVQAIYFMSIPFLILGLIIGFRKNYIFIIFSLLTLGLHLFYPYQQGLRFIMSLIPFYLFFVILGLRTLRFENFYKLSYEKFVLTAGFLLVLFFWNQNYPRLTVPWLPDGPYTKSSGEMFQYVEKNTKKTDLLAFFKPRAMYLMTGRTAVWIVNSKPLETTEADYFIFTDPYDEQKTKDFLEQNKKVVFNNDKFRIYKLR